MDEWVYRALKRWPNVPALYGWLRLDRRGRWQIRGELISHPRIIDVMNRNYSSDEGGCWYFQNGPQRGYVELEYAPLVLRVHGDALVAHTGAAVQQVTQAFMDETGALLFATEQGAGALIDDELEWALARMRVTSRGVNEEDIAQALAFPSGALTSMVLRWNGVDVPIARLDSEHAPMRLGFVRKPMAAS